MNEKIERPRIPSGAKDFDIVVTDDGSRTLYSNVAQATFHSESGAWSESKLVFIENSGVFDPHQRWQQKPLRIFEVGYGTGLNFLLAADKALQSGYQLEYVGVDHRLVESKVLRQLEFEKWVAADAMFERWLSWCEAERGLDQPFQFQSITLALHVADVSTLNTSELGLFDAVFLDAFSPDVSPALWTESFFFKLHGILQAGAKLLTYCVKSEVRRRLEAVGFDVAKLPGPQNGKREVLVASKSC